jgi:hypothetical protein
MLATTQVALPVFGLAVAIILGLIARVVERPSISRAGRWVLFFSLAAWPILAVAIIVQAALDPSLPIGVTKLSSANAAASLSASPVTFLFAAVSRIAVAVVVFLIAWYVVKPTPLSPFPLGESQELATSQLPLPHPAHSPNWTYRSRFDKIPRRLLNECRFCRNRGLKPGIVETEFPDDPDMQSFFRWVIPEMPLDGAGYCIDCRVSTT